jgi:hypothetical protein
MTGTNLKKLKIMNVLKNNIWFLLVLPFLFGSCEQEDLVVLNSDATTTVTVSSNEIVLLKENEGTDLEVLTVGWTKPDYGFQAGAKYQVLFDLAGGDFSSAQAVDAGQELSKSFKTEELNKIFLDLGLLPEEEGEIILKVTSILSSTTVISSDESSLMATPYTDVFTPIYMIGDAVLGWDTAKAVEVNGIGPKTYEVVAEFNNGGAFRFFEEASWDAASYNWTYFEGGVIDEKLENAADGDSNIRFIGETGFYRINVNLSTKTIIMTPTDQPALFMVGAAIPEAGWGWDTPVNMTWVKDGIFETTTEFANEAFRFFRKEGDWGSGLNYPYFLNEGYTIDDQFEDAQDGDNNFKFIGTPGIYKIVVNHIAKTIVLSEPGTSGPPKYMVGAAVPDAGWGWDTPIEMTQVNDGVWVATTNFVVEAFRFFDTFGDWGSGSNYPFYLGEGYTIDANFEDAQDGDNNFKFIGTPGTYTITLDSNSKTITLSN